MKSVVLLGSTGSIGASTLAVAAALPEHIRIAGLATRRNTAKAIQQAQQCGARIVAVEDPGAAREAVPLAARHGIDIWPGAEGVAALAAFEEADTVVCALVGLAGLAPVMAAMAAGHDVALATKEVMVAAGELVMRERLEQGVNILPLDSEHNALFQCLQGNDHVVACVRGADYEDSGKPAEDNVTSLALTASGGPFTMQPEVDFAKVTPEQALAHPRWSMGRKVTIDSATMMNKGLEILEARWLFNIPVERIDVLVHPESIVHSLVSFCDGSTLAQLSVPDMRVPIQYALTWPERVPSTVRALDLAKQGSLRFHEPDIKRFPSLRLAREAAMQGGTLPAVMNGANEIAVEAFLDGAITFEGIWRHVEDVMDRHRGGPADSLESVLQADAWARKETRRACGLER